MVVGAAVGGGVVGVVGRQGRTHPVAMSARLAPMTAVAARRRVRPSSFTWVPSLGLGYTLQPRWHTEPQAGCGPQPKRGQTDADRSGASRRSRVRAVFLLIASTPG